MDKLELQKLRELPVEGVAAGRAVGEPILHAVRSLPPRFHRGNTPP